MSSQHTDAIAQYSDSAEHLEMVCCILHFHKIREFPSILQMLVMDLMFMGQAAQSASQYAYNFRLQATGNYIPCVRVPLIYHKTYGPSVSEVVVSLT